MKIMSNTFSQVILFQVKPDKTDAFEDLICKMKGEQQKLLGCVQVKYMKRFFTFDDVNSGKPPRELTKIVKCVKYYGYYEFDSIENCGKAVEWLFSNYTKELMKTLVSPFDMMSGYSL